MAGIAPDQLISRAFAAAGKSFGDSAFRLVAIGKAATLMAQPFLTRMVRGCRAGLVTVLPGGAAVSFPDPIAVVEAGHPTPTQGSVAAARLALELAGGLRQDERLVVLLSGGASAMMCAPADGLTLEHKMDATRALLHAGVGIAEVNCVRKHLSLVKGGRLARAAGGRVVTWAISDIVAPVADDPSVIGSGPTVADPTTFGDALAVAERVARTHPMPSIVLEHLRQGAAGARDETPKPGDGQLAGARFDLIGTRLHALSAARAKAEALGYDVVVLPEPVIGEARGAAVEYLANVRAATGVTANATCVLSAGETTVTVRGTGKGGRNQEFALALAPLVSAERRLVVCSSVGTDGIDGPTDAAGAIVDNATVRRAAGQGLPPVDVFLHDNNAYAFFHAIGDLIHTGPTGTNVADIQVTLVGPAQ